MQGISGLMPVATNNAAGGCADFSCVVSSPAASTAVKTDLAESGVCRDFLRKVCRRGRRCKFPHSPVSASTPVTAVPPENNAASEAGGGAEDVAVSRALLDCVSFCHDHQNGQCARVSCRFVHCSLADELRFRRTGQLSVAVLEEAIARGAELRLSRHDPPVCKNFVRGECLRAAKCRYRHVTAADLAEFIARSCSATSSSSSTGLTEVVGDDSHEPDAKRRHVDEQAAIGAGNNTARLGYNSTSASVTAMAESAAPSAVVGCVSSVSLVDYRLMEDNNRMLQRQVQELRNQVEHLTTANEFLLDQNAQLRYSKHHQQLHHNQHQQQHAQQTVGQSQQAVSQQEAVAGVTTMAVQPAVSLAPTVSAAAATATPITVTPISQTLAPGQTAQVMAVPGSIAAMPVTPVTLPLPPHHRQPSTAVAVSLASVSLTQQPVAVASISSLQVGSQPTLSSIQMNPVACSISGAPAMVSYPIVSQQLRTLHPSDMSAQ